MPAPTGYTEKSLAAFMLVELADVGAALAWRADGAAFPGTTTPQLVEAVYDSQLMLATTDIANVIADDIPRLRAVARVNAWRAICKSLAARIRISTDGQSLDFAVLYQQARENLKVARAALASFAGDDDIIVGTLKREIDPYTRETILRPAVEL